MNDLIKSLSETDKLSLANELTKLFILQDRPAGKEKVAEMVEELSTRNIPAGALIAGIRRLKDEDLKLIKLATIIGAARDFIVADDQKVRCDICGSSGMVSMRDQNGYEGALACLCSNGDRAHRARGLAKWNGEEYQVVRNRNLELIHKDVLAHSGAYRRN